MNKIKKISLITLCLPFLFSCSNYSNNNSYIEDDNKILVKDFTYKDLKFCFENYMSMLTGSSSRTIDFYYYLGKGLTNNSFILLLDDYETGDRMLEGHGDGDLIEKIGNYEFNWSLKESQVLYQRAPVYISKGISVKLSKAYDCNYIDDSILNNIKNIWDNYLNEYSLYIRMTGETNDYKKN